MNRSITRMWSKTASASLTPREGTPPLNGMLAPSLAGQAQTEGTQSPARVERQANGEPKLKRRKGEPKKDADRSPPTDISLENLGGVDDVIEELNELVAMPMLYPDTYIRTGIQPPRGVLL